MGQTLAEPITTKESTALRNDVYVVGSSSMQGWRLTMEDAHTHIMELEEDPSASFFGVYDGHGGQAVAQYACEKLHKRIVQMDLYKEGKYQEALRAGFLALDQDMLADKYKFNSAGSTSVVVLVRDGKLYCANAGDSRALVCVAGSQRPLSHDHKPNNEGEMRRIIAAGGYVQLNRVNGGLALSRALGDFAYKTSPTLPPQEQVVTVFPDVIVDQLTPDHEFMVLACDGIWDVLSNQEVVDFVRARIATKQEPVAICEELMTHCLAPDCRIGGLGCDNMTVIIVAFLHGGSYDDLAAKCARPRTVTPPPVLPSRPNLVPGTQQEWTAQPMETDPPSVESSEAAMQDASPDDSEDIDIK